MHKAVQSLVFLMGIATQWNSEAAAGQPEDGRGGRGVSASWGGRNGRYKK